MNAKTMCLERLTQKEAMLYFLKSILFSATNNLFPLITFICRLISELTIIFYFD